MFHFQEKKLKQLLTAILRHNVSPDSFAWLSEKASSTASQSQFNTTFVTLPRKTGKSNLNIPAELSNDLTAARPGLHIQGWTTDRLARVWLLLHLDASDKQHYFKSIENLFLAAEVNELVALYSSLPLLAYPETWTARCAEGIRNNIGDVLKAIMCNNPYPSENLNEAAWNQMVLKAFFTEKPIEEIQGIDERANIKLAKTLSDYAHERWAAHRPVNPQLWRCIGPFIDQDILPDIQKIASSDNKFEQEAAALAISQSNYPPAKELLKKEIRQTINSGSLTWNSLAEKMKDYVLQQ